MTDLNRAAVYVPITSIEKADGGRSRIVTGVAASDRLDYDGQRADYDWLKRELTAWFGVGNMRQDHQPGGVGKAVHVEFDDDKRRVNLTSKAIADDTVRLLDEEVLKGYSWGAKTVPGNPIRLRKDADGTEWIVSGKIVEVSYVDSPANPDCFVSLVKSAGKGLRRSKVLGDLAAGDVRTLGGVDYDAILKAMLADIGRRDVSAAERERLGEQGQAIDTGQDHPSYPIANDRDLHNAIQAYGRAKPDDRAALRRHIISEARRLGRTDMVPDDWKSVSGLLKQAACNCCDDCGPDCGGDCCSDCTMAAKAVGPVAIAASLKRLQERESDDEYRAFLGKAASAADAWARTDGVSIDGATFMTLGRLAAAADEPDITKARTFYSAQNRAEVEQAMQVLRQALGLFMEGAVSIDADKDQRDSSLSGQDAPADDPGGPGSAPSDGVPDDGNMNLDPSMVRDGDPAIRQPDGRADGGARDETGKASKAERQLRKARRELAELRKTAVAQPAAAPAPAVALQVGGGGKGKRGTKALRREVEELGDELRKALRSQAAAPAAEQAAVAATVAQVEERFTKALRRLEKAMAAPPPAAPDPVAQALERIEKAVTAAAAGQAGGASQTIDSSLLLADLTRAAYEQTRKDLTEAVERLGKQVKRAERELRKATAAEIAAANRPLKESVDALGRLPHPVGPQIAGPVDKLYPVNTTIEQSLSPNVAKELTIWRELAESTDQVLASAARQKISGILTAAGLTG